MIVLNLKDFFNAGVHLQVQKKSSLLSVIMETVEVPLLIITDWT